MFLALSTKASTLFNIYRGPLSEMNFIFRHFVSRRRKRTTTDWRLILNIFFKYVIAPTELYIYLQDPK